MAKKITAVLSLLGLLALGACAHAPRDPEARSGGMCALTCEIVVQNPLSSEVEVSYYSGQTRTFLGYVPAAGSQRFVVPERTPRKIVLVAMNNGRWLETRGVRLRPGQVVGVFLRSAGTGF